MLHIVDVLNDCFPEMIEYYSGTEHASDLHRKSAEALVEKTAEVLRSRGLQTTTGVEFGDPRTKIIDAADRWGADLIVVGSHGRRTLKHFLMGSVSETVARHARCSVEIVRIPSER